VAVEREIRFDVALFTAREAAQHLGIPRSTLRAWLTSSVDAATLVHRVEPDVRNGSSIPFISMIEAHVLRGFRTLGLTAGEIKAAATRLRRELGTEYALASSRLATDGVSLLVDMSDDWEHPRWERARDGQRVIDEMIRDFLRFVTWRPSDEYPTRLKLPTYRGADVIIDPRFGFGQPVLERSKVRVEDILDAFRAGAAHSVVADEFGVEPAEVEAIVRAQLRTAA
jgi:uncharacterized protein (DUF433 family)